MSMLLMVALLQVRAHKPAESAWILLTCRILKTMSAPWFLDFMLFYCAAAPRPGNTSFKWEYDDAVPETWQVWLTACSHSRKLHHKIT